MNRKDLAKLLHDNPEQVVHDDGSVHEFNHTPWQSDNAAVFSKGGVPSQSAISEGLKTLNVQKKYATLRPLNPMRNLWIVTTWNDRE